MIYLQAQVFNSRIGSKTKKPPHFFTVSYFLASRGVEITQKTAYFFTVIRAIFMARTTKPLTFTEVDKAKPKEKAYKLYDGDGLHLAISPKGLKTWRLEFTYDSKKDTYTIGHYPAVSIADARQKVLEVKELLAKGIHPKAHHKQTQLNSKAKQTFKDFTATYLIHRKSEVEPRTLRDNTAKIEKYVYPIIGHLSLDDINKSHIKELAQHIESHKKDGKPPRETTRRTLDLVSQILKDAIRKDIIKDNATLGVKSDYPKIKGEHYPHVDIFELPRLLNDIDRYPTIITREILKFLAYTFCRTQEMRLMKWADIDWDNRIWQVNQETLKSKYKSHFVPLSDQVIDILHTMQIYTGAYEYVFYNKKTHQPYSEEVANQALERMGYKGKQTGHGFRHIASTHLHALGYHSDAIELQLHHELEGEIKQTYNHAQHHDLRREIMQAWANFLDHIKQHGFDSYQQARLRLDNQNTIPHAKEIHDTIAKLKNSGFDDEQIKLILHSLND